MSYIPSGSKLTIKNELYKRDSKPGEIDLVYTYEGKNVKKLIQFVPKLIKTIFVPTTWQQKEVNVKKGTYSAKWHVFKDLDHYTYFRVDVDIDIKFNEDEGKAKIKLGEPIIISEYPQETYWQKTFLYEILRVSWYNFFYRKKLGNYLNWGRLKISCFEEKLFKYFDKLRK
jgi:hypothetical protein